MMTQLKSINRRFGIYLLLLTVVILLFILLLFLGLPDSMSSRGFLLGGSVLAIIFYGIFAGVILKRFSCAVVTSVRNSESISAESECDIKLQAALKELKFSQDQIILAETHKSLTSIVSGFAHEINNPLTGIFGYVDLMELNNDLSDSLKKRLEGIKDQAIRIKDIIEDLSQLDPEIDQVKSEIDLSNLLDKLIKIMWKLDGAQLIDIDKDLIDEEVIVCGNHFALYQVFNGIIENAIEVINDRNIPNGKIRVSLKIDWVEKMAVAKIIDNGGGLENPLKAFNPFYTTKNRSQKRGIGLSIAYHLVQEHNGNIIIVNHEDGAEVKVILPIYLEYYNNNSIKSNKTKQL